MVVLQKKIVHQQGGEQIKLQSIVKIEVRLLVCSDEKDIAFYWRTMIE